MYTHTLLKYKETFLFLKTFLLNLFYTYNRKSVIEQGKEKLVD